MYRAGHYLHGRAHVPRSLHHKCVPVPLAKWDLLIRVFDHPDFNPIYPIMCRCGSSVAVWDISSVWIKLIRCAFVTSWNHVENVLYQTGCISSHQEYVRNKLLFKMCRKGTCWGLTFLHACVIGASDLPHHVPMRLSCYFMRYVSFWINLIWNSVELNLFAIQIICTLKILRF